MIYGEQPNVIYHRESFSDSFTAQIISNVKDDCT